MTIAEAPVLVVENGEPVTIVKAPEAMFTEKARMLLPGALGA